jgi:ABC-type phosphate transport system substrate-binding protein
MRLPAETAKRCAIVVFLSAALAATAGAAEKLRIGGAGAATAQMDAIGHAFRALRPDVEIQVLRGIGSSASIRAISSGQLDLAVSARPLGEGELKAGLHELPIGSTPLVFFIRSSDAAPPNLTRQILLDAMNGRTSSWPDGRLLRRFCTTNRTR